MPVTPARIERLAGAALALFAFLLPFELKQPFFQAGPLAVTNLELALYLALAAWAARLAFAGQPWPRWTATHTAVTAWALALVLAAAFAPVERGLALKFALRSLGGCALFFAAADLIRTPGQAARLLLAVAAGGALAAGAGLAEAWLPGAIAALRPFKTQTTLVGSFVRAGGTFQYANIAAMYWEAALPLLAGLCGWQAARRTPGAWRSAAALAALVLGEALVLSGSRAGLASAGVVLALLAAAGWRNVRPVRAPALAGLAGLGLLALAGLALSPWQALRLQSETAAEWYRADYEMTPAQLALEAGQVITVTVAIRNEGLLPWPADGAHAIWLGYHWLDSDTGQTVVFDGWRTALPQEVPPDEQVTLAANVLAPSRPGRYLLQWDMVQENVLWFSARGDDSPEFAAVVVPPPEGGDANSPLPPPPSQPTVQQHPPRAALWGAGWRMWLERPLLGVGPDNFRHIYGRYLGREHFDTRVHANSLYVETLATMGLAGGLALAGLVAALGRAAWRGWRGLADEGTRALLAGLLAALAAFLLHGVFDYFFEFTPTYGLFWLLAGAATGLLAGAERAQ